MKPIYREKNLLDYLFGGFRSTLKPGRQQSGTVSWVLRESGFRHPFSPVVTLGTQNPRKKEEKMKQFCGSEFRKEV